MKKTFSESERSCETAFTYGGEYWHAYTDGRKAGLLFKSVEDYAFAMNVVAQAADKYREIKLIAFAVMSNHFHFVLSAPSGEEVEQFFVFIKKRISRSIPAIKSIELSRKSIDNLQSLRNNIVYTNRNGYVADPDHTPFSYPWGTGRYYFNDIHICHRLSECYTGKKRGMFRGRDPMLPDDWAMLDGYIVPTSYCALSLGMSMFRNAHHYFSMVSKNVEAYSDIASNINDGEFLTDTELFARISTTLKNDYGQSRLRDLTDGQRLDLARALHYEYRSSNGQIRRILGLSQYDVDQLFPLSSSE